LRKIFNIKALRWLENAMLKMDFENTVFHKRTMLLIFEAELTESVLDFLSYRESTIGPTIFGAEEKFSK